MTPEQFVVWLRSEIDEVRSADDTIGLLADRLGASMFVGDLLEKLDTVILKPQPPQPGVPGVLGQGLMKLERQNVAWASVDPQDPNHQVQLDTSEVPVFRGGGCQ